LNAIAGATETANTAITAASSSTGILILFIKYISYVLFVIIFTGHLRLSAPDSGTQTSSCDLGTRFEDNPCGSAVVLWYRSGSASPLLGLALALGRTAWGETDPTHNTGPKALARHQIFCYLGYRDSRVKRTIGNARLILSVAGSPYSRMAVGVLRAEFITRLKI
jgi:hypothetical protein